MKIFPKSSCSSKIYTLLKNLRTLQKSSNSSKIFKKFHILSKTSNSLKIRHSSKIFK
jgi:hypothetical protein